MRPVFRSGHGAGEVCGALVGAFFILGFSVSEDEEKQARAKAYLLTKELADHFEAQHGSVICQKLLGDVDVSTPEGRQKAGEAGLFKTICPGYVNTAALWLEENL